MRAPNIGSGEEGGTWGGIGVFGTKVISASSAEESNGSVVEKSKDGSDESLRKGGAVDDIEFCGVDENFGDLGDEKCEKVGGV